MWKLWHYTLIFADILLTVKVHAYRYLFVISILRYIRNGEYLEKENIPWITIVTYGLPSSSRTIFTLNHQHELQIGTDGFKPYKDKAYSNFNPVLDPKKVLKIQRLINSINFERLKDKYVNEMILDGAGLSIRIQQDDIDKQVYSQNYLGDDSEYHKLRKIVAIVTDDYTEVNLLAKIDFIKNTSKALLILFVLWLFMK